MDADLQLEGAEGRRLAARPLQLQRELRRQQRPPPAQGALRQPWIRTDDGQWIELTTASFSHDPTGKADRLDRFMGVENGQFFLSHGGFVPGFTKYGEKFTRPATGQPPTDIVLPN